MINCYDRLGSSTAGCEPLVSRAGSGFTVGIGDDRVGVLGPDEWLTAVVPPIDKCRDRLDRLANGSVRATLLTDFEDDDVVPLMRR
jgi:hypothetical protein